MRKNCLKPAWDERFRDFYKKFRSNGRLSAGKCFIKNDLFARNLCTYKNNFSRDNLARIREVICREEFSLCIYEN